MEFETGLTGFVDRRFSALSSPPGGNNKLTNPARSSAVAIAGNTPQFEGVKAQPRNKQNDQKMLLTIEQKKSWTSKTIESFGSTGV